jgi:hypothetical protein
VHSRGRKRGHCWQRLPWAPPLACRWRRRRRWRSILHRHLPCMAESCREACHGCTCLRTALRASCRCRRLARRRHVCAPVLPLHGNLSQRRWQHESHRAAHRARSSAAGRPARRRWLRPTCSQCPTRSQCCPACTTCMAVWRCSHRASGTPCVPTRRSMHALRRAACMCCVVQHACAASCSMHALRRAACMRCLVPHACTLLRYLLAAQTPQDRPHLRAAHGPPHTGRGACQRVHGPVPAAGCAPQAAARASSAQLGGVRRCPTRTQMS